MMIDPVDVVDPVPFLDGSIDDYRVEILKNGGFGTRHLPTSKVLPHVKAKIFNETNSNEISFGPISSAGQKLGGSAQAMQIGLSAATLGVGLLNLGVSAWTAWKVHNMDKKVDKALFKLDRMESGLDVLSSSMNQRISGVEGLIANSMTHLDALIQSNARMLGFLVEHQVYLGHQLSSLRMEINQGFESVHISLLSAEARGKAEQLKTMMGVLSTYSRRISDCLCAGVFPDHSDIESVVRKSIELSAWIKTQVEAMPAGCHERLPLIIARATALRHEIDARSLLNDNQQQFGGDFEELRQLIKGEIHVLSDGATLMSLAERNQPVIEQYVFLNRAISGSVSTIMLQDGSVMPMVPEEFLVWDDGLEAVREIAKRKSNSPAPDRLQLLSVKEHVSWQEIASKPRAIIDSEIETRTLAEKLGVPSDEVVSEDAMRELLCIASKSIKGFQDRLAKELV